MSDENGAPEGEPAPAHRRPARWKLVAGLIVPVAIGVAVFVAAPMLKTGPKPAAGVERAVQVRSIAVPRLAVVPRAIGYGRIEPGRTWDAVAEVAGQVNWVSEMLEDGAVIAAGTEVLRIEDADYRLALAEADAQLAASEVRIKTARDALALARRELELLRTDLERKRTLAKRGNVSTATVEAAERAMLAGETQVSGQRNALDLAIAEQAVLKAQREGAALDLARTRKAAPFDARITNVDTGIAQYANKGQLLFTADGLDIAEVAAQFPVGMLRPLIAGQMAGGEKAGGGPMLPERGAMTLDAVVRLRTPTHTIDWPARVARVAGTIDPQTQSAGVVVAVDDPAGQSLPGARPPLFRNTFVEVELTAPPLAGRLIVPLAAIHEGDGEGKNGGEVVYIVDAESRLAMRPVAVDFAQRGFAVLKAGPQGGLDEGTRVVVSDLVAPVAGMLLAPRDDPAALDRLARDATGTPVAEAGR